jgi:ferredoxin
MKRNIISIDEERCNGCGLCVTKCAEGALKIVDGKARLVSETYCDGLGACLGECPQGAITIEEREAPSFDEKAVHEYLAQQKKEEKKTLEPLACGCPGNALRSFKTTETQMNGNEIQEVSELTQWPVQLRLVPPQAPFLKGADILVCADCVPFALPNFHRDFLKGKVVLVGCPKLDDLHYYREKLRDIFIMAHPKSITVLRMEVPCCGGIAQAVINARDETGTELTINILTVGIQGTVRKDRVPVS